MNEAYNKQLNILIHGLEENCKSARKSRDETINIIHDFMKDGLNLDFTKFAFVDYHRFPQCPVFNDEERVNRPVIIQLYNAADKRLIYSNLKKLKTYNVLGRVMNLKPYMLPSIYSRNLVRL